MPQPETSRMTGTADPDLTLSQLLSVQRDGSDASFVGRPETYGALGIYGGHFLGQALAAGFETVEEPLMAHSLHAYFLRGGDPAEPIRYDVTSLRDRPSGATRSIVASQHGKDVFQMTASFKLAEEGDTHQPQAPVVVTPDELIARRAADGVAPPAYPFVVAGRAAVESASSSFIDFTEGREPKLQLWTKTNDPGDLSIRDRQVALAYLSDGPLLFNSVLPHGAPFQTHRVTSLDHAAWFHRDIDPTHWLLFDQRSTAAAGGRGMNHGEIYAADGSLGMSVAQESMLRRMT